MTENINSLNGSVKFIRDFDAALTEQYRKK